MASIRRSLDHLETEKRTRPMAAAWVFEHKAVAGLAMYFLLLLSLSVDRRMIENKHP
jgi:hypothetical protein